MTVAQPASKRSLFMKGLRGLNIIRQGWGELFAISAHVLAQPISSIIIENDRFQLRSAANKLIKTVERDRINDTTFLAWKGRNIDLHFSDENCIDMEFTIPNGPLSDLEKMIEAQIRMNSPFDAADCYSFWKARETEAGDWVVQAAIILREHVSPLLTCLKNNNAKIWSVNRTTDSVSFSAHPGWLEDLELSASQNVGIFRLIPVVILPLFLCFAAVVASYAMSSVMVQRKQAALESSKAEQDGRFASYARLERLVRELRDAELESINTLALLGYFSEVLPDKVWLNQMVVEDGTVTMTGYAPSAAELTRLLSEAPHLKNVRFVSPVSRDNTQGVERFRIAADLVVSKE